MRKAVKDLGILYPVPMDNNYKIWRSFDNEYWPADYFIDATGQVRFHHFGEGDYDESEQWIRTLLEEANHAPLPQAASNIPASGTEAAADSNDVQSPETYVGYARAQSFASPGGLKQHDPHSIKPRLGWTSTSGRWAADGKTKSSSRPRLPPAIASPSVFTRATFTWF